MAKEHIYSARISWTGNEGQGTSSYTGYHRDFAIESADKPPIPGSSDPTFRGDPARYNPEELLVSSLSSCHMLWYLHLCSENGIVVLEYTDNAIGLMVESAGGSGQFEGIELRPRVVVSESSLLDAALGLHRKAHEMCFIARSVNFPVDIVPEIIREPITDRSPN